MGQATLLDNIPLLVKASTTQVTLASTYLGKPTRITIGGRQYKLSAQLTFDSTNPTGLNGLDTGIIAANTLYYVYACVNTSGVVGLVVSLTGPTTGPTGFSDRHKLLGRFRTDFGSTAVNTIATDASIQPQGSSIEDWVSFTPTGSWTTNTTYTGQKRRVGDTLEMCIKVALAGAPTSASLTIALPAGLTIDETKALSSSFSETNFGDGTANDSATTVYPLKVRRNTNTSVLVRYTDDAAGGVIDSSVTQAAPFTFGSGDSVTIYVRVPIVEWAGLYT